MMMLILSSNSWAQDDSPSYMFGVNSLDSTLSVYRLTAEGIPRQQSFYPTAKNPKAVAVHPSGKFLYAVAKTANAVVAYQVVYRPGRLELQNPKSYTLAAVSAFSLVIHPTGKFQPDVPVSAQSDSPINRRIPLHVLLPNIDENLSF